MIEQKIIEYAAVALNNSVSTYSVSINFLLRPHMAISTRLLGGLDFSTCVSGSNI